MCFLLGGGRFLPGVPGAGGLRSRGVPGGDTPSVTATAAGSTHPTGNAFLFVNGVSHGQPINRLSWITGDINE